MVSCIETKECDFFLSRAFDRMQFGNLMNRFGLRCAAIVATVIVVCLLRGPSVFISRACF